MKLFLPRQYRDTSANFNYLYDLLLYPLLSGLPEENISQLQLLQHRAAHVLTQTR